MYRDAWKIVAKNDANASAWTTLAAVRVRRRKIESGRSGDEARCSMRTNRPSNPAPAARKPIVVSDVQPYSTLLLIAYTIAISPAVTDTAPRMSGEVRSAGSSFGMLLNTRL